MLSLLIPGSNEAPEDTIDCMNDLLAGADSQSLLEGTMVIVGQTNVRAFSAMALLDSPHPIEQVRNSRSHNAASKWRRRDSWNWNLRIPGVAMGRPDAGMSCDF
jgi:hypothetical protein